MLERCKINPIAQDYACVEIPTDKPIAVIKSSDLHFGGLDVDYESFLSHLKLLYETDNFYVKFFGDDINSIIP